ncbi:MAG TPA: hypothetical protein VK638_04065 [Edaphobacter sp.]|nr:hypothetical protein [Edaphobacter sp.]
MATITGREQRAIQLGVHSGRPLVDLKVTVIGGSYHAEDSNPMAFEIAGIIGVTTPNAKNRTLSNSGVVKAFLGSSGAATGSRLQNLKADIR